MLENTKKSLATGLTRVKWIASFIAERTKEETSMAKTYFAKSKRENRMDDLYRDIGRRVVELNEQGEKEIFNDSVIQKSFREIQGMKKTAADSQTGPEKAGAPSEE